MDRLKPYERIVREMLERYAAEMKPRDGSSVGVVTDPEHGNYLIIRSGWTERRFVHACLVHFIVRDQKVQLLRNDTDVEWDRELIEQGVAPDDIVLVFRRSGGQNDLSAAQASDQGSAGTRPVIPVLKP